MYLNRLRISTRHTGGWFSFPCMDGPVTFIVHALPGRNRFYPFFIHTMLRF